MLYGLMDYIVNEFFEVSNLMSQLLETGFPLVEVGGSNNEIGFQHGEKCAALIREHLNILFQGLQQKGISRNDALRFSTRCVNFGARYAPHLVEELNGIAEGAGVGKEEIYVLNIGLPNNAGGWRAFSGCTTFYVSGNRTSDGSVIITQNVDNPRASRTVKRGIVLHIMPKNGPEILAFCRAGNLYVHGINSAGMVRLGNELTSLLDRDFETPSSFVCRRMLEQTTVEDAVDVIREARRGGSQANIVAENSDRVAQVEWCPDSLAVIEPHENVPNRGYFFNTNHFLHPDMRKYEGRFGERLVNSTKRLDRIRDLFFEWDGTGEKMSVETAKRFLSDHVNSPDSICSHFLAEKERKAETVACVIAQPTKKIIHVGRENPCKSEFQTYALT